MKSLFYSFLTFFLILSVQAQNDQPYMQYSDEMQQIFIFVKNKPVVKVHASSFSFKQELVVAQDATVVVYLNEDSIYHPCAEFTYNPNNYELWISRPSVGLGRAPFFDSYHKLEIKSAAIHWKMNTTTLEFRQNLFQNLDKPAFFYSQDFFEPEIMHINKGYNDKHPMLELWELFKANSFQPVSMRHVQSYFRRTHSDMLALLIEYAVQGYIDYDIKNDIISYKSKLANYLNNESKRRDYDNLFLESKSHWATLDMNNFDLTISNCEFFVLSNPNIVNVYPAHDRVIVKKNRDLHFAGRVIGGLFDFVARNCSFDYDKFLISMPKIDSMIMFSEDKTKPKNFYGDYPLKKVKNIVEDISGVLYIDDPKNKSGNLDMPDYPIFESHEGGKVYFDQPFILNAEYKRDTFYFLIDYFIIKNLDNFNISETKIPGRLVSGGIFPDIYEPLKLQPDNSLGFIHLTDSLGLPMYGGTAHYYHAIDLSNNGLRGKGRINYQTSTLESDSLVFYLKSVRGDINSFDIKPQLSKIEYPKVTTTHAKLFFEPYKNEMRVTSKKNPFALYDHSKFEGTVTLSPNALIGNGVLNFKRAELESKKMILKHHAVNAQDASLRIFDNKNDNLYSFTSNHYTANIDFNKRTGEFVAETPQEVRFINNGMKANTEAFTWKPIDQNLLRFKWKDPYREHDINTTPARILVTMKSKDNILSTIEQGRKGVSFNLRELDFDFERFKLDARGVPFIPVGDAAIIPDNGKITIYEKSVFQRLTNTRVVASRGNLYHELYNCSIQIENGDDFRGSGYYDYEDADSVIQTLHFDTIWYFRETKGNATIKPETDFTLSPHFGFNGNVTLNSNQKFLTFSGGVSLFHNCDIINRALLRINQQIDPNKILIEISEKSRDVEDRKATVAVASSNETGRIYTSFGGAKDQVNDSEYINSFGYITYNLEEQAYQAGSLEKLKNPKTPGNLISLYNNRCISIGEGAIDMGTKLGRIDFNTYGQVVNYMQADSAEMFLTTSIDFFFSAEAMKMMNDYFTNAQDVAFVDPNADKNYIQSLINILGTEEYEKYEKASRAGVQTGKLPPQLDVKFLFSTLKFMWNQENAAFESQKTIPVVVSGGKTIYKEIPGRIVIEKKGSRNNLYIYFELKRDFFFFQFENNTLSVFSSDEKFNELIENTKAKDKVLSGRGEKSFSYKLGNRGQKTRFTRKYFQE